MDHGPRLLTRVDGAMENSRMCVHIVAKEAHVPDVADLDIVLGRPELWELAPGLFAVAPAEVSKPSAA